MLRHQPPVPHQIQLKMARLGGGIDDQQVVGLDGAGDQPLAEQHLVGIAQGVAQPRRALEILTRRRLEHLALEPVDQVVALAAQKRAGLVHGRAIRLRRRLVQLAATRAGAALEVVAQAGFARLGGRRQSARASANRKYLLDQLQRRVHNAPTAERAEIARAVGGHLAGRVEAREAVLDVHFDEGVVLEVTQLHVVARLQLLDEPRLGQQRLQLRAEHACLDRTHRLQQAVHFTRVAERLAVIRGQPILQALRLADVDHLAVLVLHQVDARLAGKALPPRWVEVDAAGGSRRRQAGVVRRHAVQYAKEIRQRRAAFCACACQQQREDLRRDARIAKRAVTVANRHMERCRQAIQSGAAHARHVAPPERDGVYAAGGERRRQVAAVGLIVQEVQVEADVMADDGALGDEVAQLRQHRRRQRRARQHLVADAGKLGDELRDAPLWIDQLRERVEELAAAHDHRPDLDQPVTARRQAGRFHVYHGELGAVEGQRAGIPGRKPPHAAIIAREKWRGTQQLVHQLLPRRGERVWQCGAAEHMPGKLRPCERLPAFVQQVARAPQERTARRWLGR